MNAHKQELERLIISYQSTLDPNDQDYADDIESFKSWVEYMEELKQASDLTQEEQEELNKYKNIQYDIDCLLIDKLNKESKHISHNPKQVVNNNKHFINIINDIKKRSKAGVVQTDNITAIQSCTVSNVDIVSYKGFNERNDNGYTDLYIEKIASYLNDSCYELLPYRSVDFYGCEYVKTCFNTIGKDYEYISPFIDYDLTSSERSLQDELATMFQLISVFMSNVLQRGSNHVSIVGYSNKAQSYDHNEQYGYTHIQYKPNSGKLLSVHIVIPDIKIHCIEFISRIESNIDILKQFKAFDIAPYKSGSLRHMGSAKNGLSDHPEDKKVTDLTHQEILDQFITYYNDRLKPFRIDLDINHIHNHKQAKHIEFKSSSSYEVELTYCGQSINQVESIVKSLIDQHLIDVSYSQRWNLLRYYIQYKSAMKEELNIAGLIGVDHDHVDTQINFLLNCNLYPSPKPLLSYIKSFIPSQFEYKIINDNNKVVIHHFGQNKIEDLKKCNNYKEIIEVLTGSIASKIDGNYVFIAYDGIHEYRLTGRPNDYVSKQYPSKLNDIIHPEDFDFNECNDEGLKLLFKHRFEDLSLSNRKKEIKLNAHTFIQLLNKYYDTYQEDGETRFKLNGYDVKTVKEDVYKDVVDIIKLFENRLVEQLQQTNPLQEFLRAVKYLLTHNEKCEKLFVAVDRSGATGKSLFFSKIIKDMFGIAGLNDDSMNCLDSSFSDSYNYLYTVFNEVSKGKHTTEQCSSKLKQLSDNVITSARVKNVQNIRSYKNKGIFVLLSNSVTLNGALDYTDEALMSRIVYIEFKPFENNGEVDPLGGNTYYKLIDKYKSHNDAQYIYSYDFRNALYKYIMNIDISSNTTGRAQPSEYKDEIYKEIAKDELNQINNNARMHIDSNNVYNVDLDTKTLKPFSFDDEDCMIGFKLTDIKGLPHDANQRKLILKSINYKSAYYKRMRYNLDSIELKDNRLQLVICERKNIENIIEIHEGSNDNMLL